MSTSILPDDSVVIRLPGRTVHVDPRGRWVHVRAADREGSLEGSLVASHDFGQVRRVRLLNEGSEVGVELELVRGGRLPLGRAPSLDLAMHTGRTVADLCRCQLDAGGGVGTVREASIQFTEASTFEAPGGLGGVVPLSNPDPETEPPTDQESERATDEQLRPPDVRSTSAARSTSAPARAPMPRTDSLHRVTRELSKADVDAAREEPVFEALLRESEMAAAMDPLALAESLAPRTLPDPPPEDLKETLVGVAAVGRPQAVAELLELAAERLPVATHELPSSAPRRGRTRPRPRS